jgi:phosphohistidine swiveling domain-containing protein
MTNLRGLNMSRDLLVLLDRQHKLTNVGGKAANLHQLQRLGKRIPRTFVLGWEAYQRYMQNDLSVIESISNEIERKLDERTVYAVRSSANIEDSFEYSFAGQFKSVLNVTGRDAILQAIWSVWATSQTPTVQEYLSKHNFQGSAVQMAVIIQEMIHPVISGVAFSRNPMNGLHETVVEAVYGQGTQLVQEGKTPRTWIYRNGNFALKPEDNEIPQALIEEVVRGTRNLARRMKYDVDLEWVFDGQQLYWLQMREITTLREVQIYSNSLSKEMIGGIIKPLIWSINIPLVNGAWIRLITEIIGTNQLEPYKLAKSFYYRSYFNMGLLGEIFEELGFPAESLEMAWGIAPKGTAKFRFRPRFKALRLVPRLARFSWDKWTMGKRLERRLEELKTSFYAIDLNAIAGLSPEELLQGIDSLFSKTQEAAYYNIVLPLLMYAYNAVLRSQLEQAGVDYTMVDMQLDTPDFQTFNPGYHLEKVNRKFQALSPTLQEQIRSSSFQNVMKMQDLDGFRDGLADLILKFGHLSDNGNDFSTTPWRENSDAILQLVIEDQHIASGQRGEYQSSDLLVAAEKIRMESIQLPLWKGWMLRRLQRRTRKYNLYRERISYIYTYGYGLFRSYFLALGAYLVSCDILDSPSDIFYLEYEQIRRAIQEGTAPEELRQIAAGHKQAIERVRSIQYPNIIYGNECPPIHVNAVGKLSGTPTSRGYCTGKARVVTGLQDFHKLQPGDVLVIPYSDVGWTPLFAKAAGVIAESGGMLSHSSIIAREYGIPAIVSVPDATSLQDGTLVSMDGYLGKIVIHDENDSNTAEISDRQTQTSSIPGAQIANP